MRGTRRAFLLPALLIGVDFVDELWSGVPSVGSPGIQAFFGLTYTQLSLVLFVLPELVSVLLEPPLFILSDRLGRKRFVCTGLLLLALCNFVAGWTASLWLFVLAMTLSFPASGCGVHLAQVSLMDTDPGRREQLMTRWTFAGTLGDLAAPALFALLALFAWGWREAFMLMGVVLFVYTLLLLPQRFPAPVKGKGDDEPSPSLVDAVREAVRNRRLLAWLGGVWLCSLLDEILVVFGSLHMRDLGLDLAFRSVALMAFSLGALVGLAASDRLLRRVDPLHLLAIAGVSCTGFYLAWILHPTGLLGPSLLFCVGLAGAPLYPIAMAQAYRTLPDQAGMVSALGHLFFPLTLALPFVLGTIADHVGLVATLLVLTAQPVGLFVLAVAGGRSGLTRG